jgi:hypothetical protein
MQMSKIKGDKSLILAIISGVIWLILCIVGAWIVSYTVNRRLSKATSNSKNMLNNLKNESVQIQHAFSTNEINRYPLVDFYISGSYNCCSAGELQDDWVSLEPLKIVLKRGIRCLDFEIYMLPSGIPVVAVGKNPVINSKIKCKKIDIVTKGSYDYVSIPDVFDCINSYGFNSAPTQNDPIFLNFRIRTKNVEVFKLLEQNITGKFVGKLLEPRYGRGGKLLTQPDQYLYNRPLTELKNKVIIMVEDFCGNYKSVPGFFELVNLEGTPGNLRIYTDTEIKNADMKQLIKENKNTIALCKPNDTLPASNLISRRAREYGCQILLMNFHVYNTYLKEHVKFFREKGTSIVLKPKHLRKVRNFAKLPDKRNDDLEGLNKKVPRTDPVTGKSYTY